MNVIGALMPGLREARAPLTAGVLWCVFAFLALSVRFGEITPPKSGVLATYWENGSRVASSLPLPGLSAGIIFFAYVIGLISVEIFSALARGWVRTKEAGRLLVAFRFIRRGSVGLTAKPDGAWWPSENDDMNEETLSYFSVSKRLLSIRFIQDASVRNEIASAFRIEHLRAMEYFAERDDNVELPWDPTDRDLRETLCERGTRGQFALRQVADALVANAERDDDLRGVVLSVTVNIAQYYHRVREDIRHLPETLGEKAPATFDRWDRIRSEYEFRSAMVPPLILGPITLRILGGIGSLPLALLLLCGVTMNRMAASRRRAAGESLISVYESDVLTTATKEHIQKQPIALAGLEVPEFLELLAAPAGALITRP